MIYGYISYDTIQIESNGGFVRDVYIFKPLDENFDWGSLDDDFERFSDAESKLYICLSEVNKVYELWEDESILEEDIVKERLLAFIKDAEEQNLGIESAAIVSEEYNEEDGSYDYKLEFDFPDGKTVVTLVVDEEFNYSHCGIIQYFDGKYEEAIYNRFLDMVNFIISNENNVRTYKDEMLEKLVSYFAQAEEKTVIVFFGDHQPSDSVVKPILKKNGINVSNMSEEDALLRYQVPYVVWANFDIKEEVNADMDISFLAASVLEKAKMPTSAYQSFLLDLKENPEDEMLLKQYEILQYYFMFDY